MKIKKAFNSKIWLPILVSVIFVVSAVVSYNKNGTIIWDKIFDAVNLSDSDTEEDNYAMGVHFLNVGKADCTYIKCKETNILIDSADRDISPSIVEYLNRCGIKKLDLVIASHPHRDHIGQMYNVIDSFNVACFVMPEVPPQIIPTSFTYRKMLESLDSKKVNVKVARPGEKFEFSGLTVDILGPCRKYENMNDNSVVAKVSYGLESFLFMGDAEKNAELDLIENGINLKSDVLKVGHHGSKTSSTKKFLKSVSPNYAVISSGPDRNNLPKKEVLDRLANFNIKLYRTDTMGNITFLTNGDGLKITTEKKEAA